MRGPEPRGFQPCRPFVTTPQDPSMEREGPLKHRSGGTGFSLQSPLAGVAAQPHAAVSSLSGCRLARLESKTKHQGRKRGRCVAEGRPRPPWRGHSVCMSRSLLWRTAGLRRCN